jgi:hypothetical protein
MIRHVVLLAWIPEATDAQKLRVAAELNALPPLMKGLRSFRSGPDAGIVDGNFDYAIVADFDDADSYLAYRHHPAHRAVITETIDPILSERVAVQYQL